MATVVASQIFGIITYSNGLYLVMIISHEKGVSYRGVARVGRDKGLSPPTTTIIYLKYIYFIVCQIHEHIYWHINYWYNIIIQLNLEHVFIAQCTFPNIMPKMCFTITANKDCMISV